MFDIAVDEKSPFKYTQPRVCGRLFFSVCYSLLKEVLLFGKNDTNWEWTLTLLNCFCLWTHCFIG